MQRRRPSCDTLRTGWRQFDYFQSCACSSSPHRLERLYSTLIYEILWVSFSEISTDVLMEIQLFLIHFTLKTRALISFERSVTVSIRYDVTSQKAWIVITNFDGVLLRASHTELFLASSIMQARVPPVRLLLQMKSNLILRINCPGNGSYINELVLRCIKICYKDLQVYFKYFSVGRYLMLHT
jgi:hypothetical protein